MVKINDSKESQDVFIEYDLYVPFDIKIGKRNATLEPIVYWRRGDFEKSLIEVGIGKNDHEIHSITLLICNDVNKNKKACNNFLNTTIGCPIMTICDFEQNTYIDEKGMLSLEISENSIHILFSESEAVKCIKNKNIEFLLDTENNWIGLCIKGIVEEDLKILQGALRGK